MNFKKLSESDLHTLWGHIDIEGMEQEKKSEYIEMYNTYRALFTEYIIDKLNLKSYDKKITESNLRFSQVNDESMDVYQYFSNNELNYFYIRNNIYLNKLSEDENSYLREKIKKQDIQLNKETVEFIEETYEKIIYEGNSEEHKGFLTLYGPNSRTYMAPNDAVIIGVRYNEYDLQELSDKEWSDLNMKQMEFLYPFIKNMKEEIKENLKNSISIIQYNDFSIIRRSQKVEK